MKPINLFSYTASFLIIPFLLLSLTGCGLQEENEDIISQEENLSQTEETINEDNYPSAVRPKQQPVLNPEGAVGPSTAVVIFPNGHEQLEAGKSYNIAWEAKGFNKINIGLEEKDYSRGSIAKEVLAASGTYTWTPVFTDGNEDGHTMNLQIVLSDASTGEVLDKSDSSFIIKAARE